eukprot:CAMPEP_0184687302 /NCGR_PEP_ID=MMETSP0312-20130426/25897_1 /TAXON_ID=31354 /ORGANISM="Compsopogon coeruleus, Strain SAG 36.94" /LENGTH=616 /DNA_ID=CAMNT_0027143279 /DNA_START=327 /DNA_END=2177 /DNA_ORIENTATION=-
MIRGVIFCVPALALLSLVFGAPAFSDAFHHRGNLPLALRQTCYPPPSQDAKGRCGATPTRQDIVIHRTDSPSAMTEKIRNAPAGSFIFIESGTRVVTNDVVRPNDGITIWAYRGSNVVWDGQRRGNPAIQLNMQDRAHVHPRRGVRIYGIHFTNFYFSNPYNAIIMCATNAWSDGFNAAADARYGYNPPNPWSIDCNTFSNFHAPNSQGAAVSIGSGQKVRGNLFQDSSARAIWAVANGVEISGNTFINIQWSGLVVPGMHGAIRLMLTKNAVVTNNKFQNIGGSAVWFDTNNEKAYVGYNSFSNVGYSCVMFEISGGGSTVEHNKCLGYSMKKPATRNAGAVDTTTAGIYLSTSGGNDYTSGIVIQGNVVVRTAAQAKIRGSSERLGFLEMDQSKFRNSKPPAYSVPGVHGVGPRGTPVFGRLPDSRGSTRPGTASYHSDNNRWYGNVALNTMRNGVAMRESDRSANTYKSTKWQLNQLTGGMLYGEGGSPSGKLMLDTSPQQLAKAGIDTMNQVTLNNANGLNDKAFNVVIQRASGGVRIVVASTTLSGPVQYQVSSQPCGGSYAPGTLVSVGTIGQVGGQGLFVRGCSCQEFVVRALYQGMYGAFSRLSTASL